MGLEELKSKYYIHNGYLIVNTETAYRLDTIRDIYFKGSFLYITFKDFSHKYSPFDVVDSDTVDFFQELNKERLSRHASNLGREFVLYLVIFCILCGMTLGLLIGWLLLS